MDPPAGTLSGSSEVALLTYCVYPGVVVGGGEALSSGTCRLLLWNWEGAVELCPDVLVAGPVVLLWCCETLFSFGSFAVVPLCCSSVEGFV